MTAPINQLMPIGATTTLPALVAAAGERASVRFLEFFAANVRNPHTRRAYYRAAEEFLTWCASAGVPSIVDVQPCMWRRGSRQGRVSLQRPRSSSGSQRCAICSTGWSTAR